MGKTGFYLKLGRVPCKECGKNAECVNVFRKGGILIETKGMLCQECGFREPISFPPSGEDSFGIRI